MTDRLIEHRKKFLEDWFDFNGVAMFFILCLVYFALLFVKKVFIIESIAAFEILNERGDMWVFDLIYSVQYLSIPLFLTWKFIWTTLFLWIGCFMFGYRLHFNKLYKLVMLLEIFFFLPEILKIIWFTLFFSDPNYNDYMAFYPLSLINLFNYTQIDPKWHYPLKSLNIFEFLYWPLMIFGIYFLSGKSLKISSFIVASSYILFFFIWLVFYLLVF